MIKIMEIIRLVFSAALSDTADDINELWGMIQNDADSPTCKSIFTMSSDQCNMSHNDIASGIFISSVQKWKWN